ncbi:MAG: adenine deaminase [Ignavibacteria bacterium]|jgi:adenine deaminase|nr:adenine deaminase [Ignavibacteria bacterium]
MKIKANLVDVINKTITPSLVTIDNGKVVTISQIIEECDNYILPPFIDSHVHIESSMVTPSEFARAVSVHGTVAVVADPHEMANVMGKEGIRYFVDNSKLVPFKFYFGVPSCVPATDFETSGHRITAADIEELFEIDKLNHLGEVMNFMGIVVEDTGVMAKINVAKKYNKLIDGHAPRLSGMQLSKYINAGITTDHESTTLEEAEEKIILGMKIQIRTGSVANDFDALIPLLDKYPDKVMFCFDDIEPDQIVKSHINHIVKQAVERGYDLMNTLRAATLNPKLHYNLDVGMLQQGDDADFIVVNNLIEFKVLQTYCKGKKIAENGKSFIEHIHSEFINNFKARPIEKQELVITIPPELQQKNLTSTNCRVIGLTDKLLITEALEFPMTIEDDHIVVDTEQDILKLVSINRYKPRKKPTLALVHGLGFNDIALATSISHDSHNIIASGSSDELLCTAINALIEKKGGIAVAYGDNVVDMLELPIAGLVSNKLVEEVAQKLSELNYIVANHGATVNSPIMMLSFLGLLVIPALKISDKGLFDVVHSVFTSVFVEDDLLDTF